MQVGGASRRYLLALPQDLDRPAPVVVDLHGLGESAEKQQIYSGLSQAGPPAGVIVATPASDNPANSWAIPVLNPKDASFVGAILDQLEANRCVDTSREVAAGISNGAGLADGLVCALNGRLAAIFPVAGVNIVRPCATAKPTTVIAFHGTADPLIPYAGGAMFAGAPGGTETPRLRALLGADQRAFFSKVRLQPVETTIAGWASIFHCRPPQDSSAGTGVQLRTYSGCDGAATVELYTIAGGGHTWPGASIQAQGLGATTQSISASEIIMNTLKTLRTRA